MFGDARARERVGGRAIDELGYERLAPGEYPPDRPDSLRCESGVELNVGQPKVNYRETVRARVQHLVALGHHDRSDILRDRTPIRIRPERLLVHPEHGLALGRARHAS